RRGRAEAGQVRGERRCHDVHRGERRGADHRPGAVGARDGDGGAHGVLGCLSPAAGGGARVQGDVHGGAVAGGGVLPVGGRGRSGDRPGLADAVVPGGRRGDEAGHGGRDGVRGGGDVRETDRRGGAGAGACDVPFGAVLGDVRDGDPAGRGLPFSFRFGGRSLARGR